MVSVEVFFSIFRIFWQLTNKLISTEFGTDVVLVLINHLDFFQKEMIHKLLDNWYLSKFFFDFLDFFGNQQTNWFPPNLVEMLSESWLIILIFFSSNSWIVDRITGNKGRSFHTKTGNVPLFPDGLRWWSYRSIDTTVGHDVAQLLNKQIFHFFSFSEELVSERLDIFIDPTSTRHRRRSLQKTAQNRSSSKRWPMANLTVKLTIDRDLMMYRWVYSDLWHVAFVKFLFRGVSTSP